ncbi:MAG: ATP-binding protein [Cocleimonas sp.]
MMFALNYFVFEKQFMEQSTLIQQTIEQGLLNKTPQQWEEEVKTYNALESDFTLSLLPWESLTEFERTQLKKVKDHRLFSDNTLGEKDLYSLSLVNGSIEWVLKIDEANDDGDASSNDWMEILILFSLLFLSLAFTLFLLIKKLTQPIDHLVTIAEKLGKGERQARARRDLLPPMNILALEFNNMAESLDETLKEQQILIGAIPHELRSPLARIRFALDMTRNNTTVEVFHKDIEKIDGFVDDMQKIIEEVLELNRLQNHTNVTRTEFDLCLLFNELLAPHQQEAPELKITLKCEERLSVSANAPLLKRAISNVLNNALRYANERIIIKAGQSNNETYITIEDDGKGIDQDKLNNIFAPFSTLNDSRNRKTSGIGLGLSIVKLIMKKHQGDVVVNHGHLGGAWFKLSWKNYRSNIVRPSRESDNN